MAGIRETAGEAEQADRWLGRCPGGRGVLMAAEGRWEAAVSDHGRALGSKSLPPSLRRLILENRAHALERIGRRKQAAADLAESRRLAPAP